MKSTFVVALCFLAATNAERQLAKAPVTALEGEDAACQACQFGVDLIKNILDETIDREQLLEQALAACNFFPEDLQQDCRDMQEASLNIIFATIDTWVTEEVICQNWLQVC